MENKNKQFPYRIGLDLGTSSIGVAIYSLDKEGNINKLEHLDSYIFGEPVVSDKPITLNAGRRSARLIRRQIERKAARLKKISHISKTLGVTEKELYEIRNQDVHKLRAQALSEPLTMPQFIKVLCHIVKNRGYNGTIKEGKIEKKIQQTENLLNDNKTLGQILYENKQKSDGQPWRKLEDDGTFIYRKDVEREFELIWQEQAKHLPQLNGNYQVGYHNMFPDYPNVKELPLKDALRSALFYQRPIYWDPEKVGNCEIYHEEKRVAVSQIAYQNYRLAKEIANLRIYNSSERTIRPLTRDEQNFLFDYISSEFKDYNAESLIPFNKIYEKLSLKENEIFNQDRKLGAKKGIKGNTTFYAFYKTKTLGDWESLEEKPQELVLEFLNNITTFSDIQDNDNAYIKKRFEEMTKNLTERNPYPQKDKQAAIDFILKLKEKNIFADNKFSLEKDRSSYGLTALKTITDGILKGREEQAIIKELVDKTDVSVKEKMRSVAQIKQQEAINSPVITKALNEFHRVMQYILSRYGKPDEIVIELSREIKNSLERRFFLERQNKSASEERQDAIKELRNIPVNISPSNIERYLLWKEQNKTCPYSGKNISVGQAFDEKQTQIDHIIPQNWQGGKGGPNVFSNKVLVFTEQNKDKGNKLPYEWKFKDDIDSYISWRKENSTKKKKGEQTESYGKSSFLINFVEQLWSSFQKEKKGFYSEANHKWTPTQKGVRILDKINNLLITPEQVKDDFVARQNQETAWIGKIVMDWCKDICPKITPSYGALTAYLREQLQFDRILPSVRISEGKKIFDKDDNEINSEQWKELFDTPNINYKEIKALKEDFEKYLQQLPQQPNTEDDKKKCFYKFCKEKHTLFEFNKRCDHRHHAVDAAVIGLCNLSMVQKASAHNGKNGTLYRIKFYDEKGNHIEEKDTPGFEIDNIPQYGKIKDIIKTYLTDYVVWHKPDHYPSGAFFKDTAYNLKDNNLIRRGNIGSKTFLGSTPEKTIKNIDLYVYGNNIKKEIIKQFKERLLQGMTQEEALCGKKDFPLDGILYRGNKIKMVKYRYSSGGSGLRNYKEEYDSLQIHKDRMEKEHIKVYENGGYACMDFDDKTGKRISLIPIWRYTDNQQIPNGIIRIFANDIIFNKKEKIFYKVQSFKERDGVIACLTTEIKSNLKSISNIKDYIVVKSRQDIAKIKKEYAK